jgi:acylphosphatase
LEASKLIRQQVRFIGRVQGVGFRASTQSIARDFEVTGWVRNEDDGSVVVEVQGEETPIKDFLTQVQAVLARFIKSMTTAPLPVVQGETAFTVRR